MLIKPINKNNKGTAFFKTMPLALQIVVFRFRVLITFQCSCTTYDFKDFVGDRLLACFVIAQAQIAQ